MTGIGHDLTYMLGLAGALRTLASYRAVLGGPCARHESIHMSYGTLEDKCYKEKGL
jgi:hypothetical protein